MWKWTSGLTWSKKMIHRRYNETFIKTKDRSFSSMVQSFLFLEVTYA